MQPFLTRVPVQNIKLDKSPEEQKSRHSILQQRHCHTEERAAIKNDALFHVTESSDQKDTRENAQRK